MTKYFKYSKRLHLATLCCFLLPFFYTGCGPSAEEKAAKEKYMQDSIATETINTPETTQDSSLSKSVDTIIQSNISQVDASKEKTTSRQSDTLPPKTEEKSGNPSEKLSEKFTFLRPFLIPNANTYSGIATVIDSIIFITFFSVFISFLFLIISLTIKFVDSSAKKTIALLDTLGLFFLLISQPYTFSGSGGERLFGFWVGVIFVFALTIYDFYLIILNKRAKTKL